MYHTKFHGLKHILICIISFTMCIYSQAQDTPTIDEPEFTGECLLIANGEGIPLDKEFCKLKSKANIGLAMVGYAKAKSEIQVKSPSAQARTTAGPVSIIVRATDNTSDPLAIVKIFKFKKGKKDRKSELSSYDMFGGMSENNQELMKFSAKKYGTSSYILKLANIEEGEYGIIVTNPNSKDEKSVIISCFGVD